MKVTDEDVQAAWDAWCETKKGSVVVPAVAMRAALESFALSHAAGQDGEQCRAASDRAEVAVDLPKIRRLVGPRPMIYMNSFDGQPPCLTLNNACGVIHDLMDEVERLRALSRGVPEGMVLVPRSSAEMAAVVCDEWGELFVGTPGFDKYERFNYGPAVEMLRDELRAIAAQRKGGE